MLATGPKVRGFDSDRGRWIFKGDKNPEHNFLRYHVVDLRHVKEPPGMNRTSKVSKQYSSGHFSPKSPDCQMALVVSSGLSKNLCGQ
jgi:hypothetical protein